MENNLTKYNSVKEIGRSDYVMMGNIRLRQPLPTQQIEMADPFILLHHFGPFEISPEKNPLDLGPHPHRGFEPVTFLIEGEQLHRDSLGNHSIVKGGDVQWTTAGRGVIHSEGPSKDFVQKGGFIEGIQLWVNLPSNKKMIPANYQHVRKNDFESIVDEENNVEIRIVTGDLSGKTGKIKAQTTVNSYFIEFTDSGKVFIDIKENHSPLLYLTEGNVQVNDNILLKKNDNQLVTFHQDGKVIKIESYGKSKLLFLSAEPLNEPVASYGPYVMNTQTEILEAMRDYQMGKMGYLSRD